MYIRCYDSRGPESVQDQLWRLVRQGAVGWMSAYAVQGYIRWYIPEDRVSLALLIDSELVARPEFDYLV